MRKFCLGNKTFRAIPIKRKIFQSRFSNGTCSESIDVELIFSLSDGDIPKAFIGTAFSKAHAAQLIEEFFSYSFCYSFLVSESPTWCIRCLPIGDRKKIIDTDSLCGNISKGHGFDLVAPVSLEHDNVCPKCAWLYWQDLLTNNTKKGENG